MADSTREWLGEFLRAEAERAKIPHEDRCNRGRHYRDKNGRLVCDQTPVPRYMWRVIDRDLKGSGWDRTIRHPRSRDEAQKAVDELNAAEPKRSWWKGRRYYAVGWQEWAWNGGKVRYLR